MQTCRLFGWVEERRPAVAAPSVHLGADPVLVLPPLLAVGRLRLRCHDLADLPDRHLVPGDRLERSQHLGTWLAAERLRRGRRDGVALCVDEDHRSDVDGDRRTRDWATGWCARGQRGRGSAGSSSAACSAPTPAAATSRTSTTHCPWPSMSRDSWPQLTTVTAAKAFSRVTLTGTDRCGHRSRGSTHQLVVRQSRGRRRGLLWGTEAARRSAASMARGSRERDAGDDDTGDHDRRSRARQRDGAAAAGQTHHTTTTVRTGCAFPLMRTLLATSDGPADQFRPQGDGEGD